MKYLRYPVYKDSNVDWIGEVPSMWNVTKLKYIIQSFIGGGTPSTNVNEYWNADNGIPWISITDITRANEIQDTERRITNIGLASKNLTLLPPGTIIYSMYASVGKVSKLLITATTNQAILGLINKESSVLNNYLRFALEAFEPYIGFLFSSNTQNNINEEKVKNIWIPLCDLGNQRKIVEFLTIRINKIDNLSLKIKKMIELLQEKRQAIITHTVTKGLDSDVPMKDSSIEWIGSIPSHWKIQKLKRSFNVLNGSTPKSNNPLYWDGNITWITPEDMSKTLEPIINSSSRQITEDGYSSCGTNLVPKGSLIVSTRAPIGYIKIAGVELCTNQGCRSLVKKKELNEMYFFYYLSCLSNVLNSLGQGSTFLELSSESLKTFQVVTPPLDEQISITKFLYSEISQIDQLISKNLKLIDLLKEYKESLITQAVTGKIDLREFNLTNNSNCTES